MPPASLSLLSHDRDVAAWSGVDYTDAEIDGQTFPILLTGLHDKVAPPILSGHGLDANDQIVLGAATMSELHKRIGDSVVASYGSAEDAPIYVPPTKLTIVGTATLPAVGYSSFVAEHTSMGTGAIVPLGIQPPAMANAMKSPDPNLNGYRTGIRPLAKHGLSTKAGRADMQRIASATNKIFSRTRTRPAMAWPSSAW